MITDIHKIQINVLYITPNFNFLAISVNLFLKISGKTGKIAEHKRIIRKNCLEKRRKITRER